MNRNYTEFQKHVDNALEKVQGEHLNKIQDAVNGVQADITEVYNRNFLDDSLFVLENNPYVNMMFFVDFATQDEIFRAKSSNYIHNAKNHCVTATGQMGVIHTIGFKSDYGNIINNYILKVDASVPTGCIIKYYISTDLSNYYPIKAGESTPLELKALGEQVYIKAELYTNRKGDSPVLFAMSLFYKDELLDQSNSITNPNLTQLPTDNHVAVGDTVIVYDPLNNGRVKMVLEADGSSTQLLYDDTTEGGGRLAKTIETSGTTITQQELIYGTFTDSSGNVTEVLKSIRTTDISSSGGANP